MEKFDVCGQIFKICPINDHLKIVALSETAEKIRKGIGENFIRVMDGYVQEVAALPLAYRIPPVFYFIVLPRGDIFKKLSRIDE